MMNTHDLENMMANLEENNLLAALSAIAQSGEHAELALEALQNGMSKVGDRFEEGEYFVSDLIYAGAIMTEAMEILKPLISSETGGDSGRLILCTVKGDLHDIGKNIVKTMMEAAGFDVVDLGIDVSPERIVRTAKDQDIGIIALSGVLTLAINSMKDVVDAFREAGFRDRVKILIGGNPVSEESCMSIGADAWAHSPQKGVNICKAWVAEC